MLNALYYRTGWIHTRVSLHKMYLNSTTSKPNSSVHRFWLHKKNEDLGVNPTDLVEFLRSASETLFQMEYIGNYPPCTQTLSILRDKAMSQWRRPNLSHHPQIKSWKKLSCDIGDLMDIDRAQFHRHLPFLHRCWLLCCNLWCSILIGIVGAD